MARKIKPIVRINIGRKPKAIKFTSTRSNIRKVIETTRYSKERLIKEIGEIKVSDFFNCLKGQRYERFLKAFGNQKMNEFLDYNEKLYLEIIKNEIYK